MSKGAGSRLSAYRRRSKFGEMQRFSPHSTLVKEMNDVKFQDYQDSAQTIEICVGE